MRALNPSVLVSASLLAAIGCSSDTCSTDCGENAPTAAASTLTTTAASAPSMSAPALASSSVAAPNSATPEPTQALPSAVPEPTAAASSAAPTATDSAPPDMTASAAGAPSLPTSSPSTDTSASAAPSVSGSAPPVTGPVDADPATDSDAETLLHLSVKFYGAQRSGAGPNWILQGRTCHTADGESIEADLSGGWHDAGDHVKPTLTNAFASYALLKAFEVFGSAFADKDDQAYSGAPNGIPDVLDEVRYATDYLVKAHTASDALVGMVGNADYDHSNWVTCAFQETLTAEEGGRPRPVSMDANADIAGLTAAALALMAQQIRPYDATLADTYLSHAVEIYDIGKANPTGSNPGLYAQTGGFGGAQWTDEMLCGAIELYRATGEQTYLTDALDFNTQTDAHFWAPNWGQSADWARHSLYMAGETEAALQYWQQDVDNYAAKVSTATNVTGLIYFDEWGSLRYAANAAFSAALLHAATGNESAGALAQSQLDYITGNNEYDRSFVVGFGNNPPQEPHHRNAHGHDEDDMSLPFLHSLAGALVGGPTREGAGGNTVAGYQDDVSDYVTNEVALDYNAGLVGLAAFAVSEERL